ncbi:MAG: Fur family transcriptional regulator [Acidimicrobiia bacterium]
MHVNASDMVEALRRSGLRITVSRQAICEVLATDHHNHLTANDLLAKVNQKLRGKVAPSTIYRTIDALEAEGLLEHVHLGHGPAVLHLSDDSSHHHLVCESCGRTIDVDTGAFDAAIGLLAAKNGFVANSVHYALIGQCEECAAIIASHLQ